MMVVMEREIKGCGYDGLQPSAQGIALGISC